MLLEAASGRSLLVDHPAASCAWVMDDEQFVLGTESEVIHSHTKLGRQFEEWEGP